MTDLTANNLRRMLPRISSDATTQYQFLILFWIPQLPADGIKREMLFVDENDKFIHTYLRRNSENLSEPLAYDLEPWPISDEKAEEWIRLNCCTPSAWPFNEYKDAILNSITKGVAS